MHKGCALGFVALMILCSPVGSVTAEEKKPANAIRVLEATYGGNCEGVAKGNVTKFIASTCDGTDLCNYHVYYKKMGGDPAMGCKKTFRVTFICGKNTKNPETCAWRPRRARRVRTARQTIFAFCTVSAKARASVGRQSRRRKEPVALPVAPRSLHQQSHQILNHHHRNGNGGEPPAPPKSRVPSPRPSALSQTFTRHYRAEPRPDALAKFRFAPWESPAA